MASLLEDLAQGMRGAGAILSPTVYQNQVQEQNQIMTQFEQRRQLVARQIMNAAQSGAIAPADAQAGLAKLGYGGVPVGPGALTQERMRATTMRNKIAQDISAMPPEDRANPLNLANVFMTNGDYQTGAKYIDAHETRQARIQQAKDTLQQRADALQARLEDQSLNREQRDQIARMMDETRRQGQALTAQIGQGNQDLRRLQMQQRAGEYSLPNGSRITHGQILQQYKLDNKLMNDLDLQILAKTDPERAAQEREKIANAQPFADYAKSKFGVDVFGGQQATPPVAPNPAPQGAQPSAGSSAQPAGVEQRKTLGGKSYVKVNGQWFEE